MYETMTHARRMGWVIGIFAGITIALLILLIRIILRGQKNQYDERQVAARGIAYKCGFFTLMLCEVLYSVLNALNLRFADDIAGPILGIFPALAVFGSVAVMKDAYFGVNESKSSRIIWGVVGVLWTAIGVTKIASGEGVADGLLTIDSLQLFLGVTFLIIAAAQIVHALMNRGRNDGE